MNNFIVYINGVLVSSDMFDVVTSTTGEYNNIALATCQSDQKLPGKDVKSIDVMEMRSGICIRRYRYDRPEAGQDDHLTVIPSSQSPAVAHERLRFRCLSVPNAF